MIKSSEKEYEHLQREVQEIKNCITKYLGYIIAVAGGSGLVFRYTFQDESKSHLTLFATIVTLIILTFLFDIIWYKFKSHNRHVGYIQMLSQELVHIPIDEFESYSEYKAYLDKFQDLKIENEEEVTKNSIFTWQYSMSRFFSSDMEKTKTKRFTKRKDKLLTATQRSNFIFKLSKGLKYESLPYETYSQLDTNFFREVIFPLYGNNRNYESIKNQILRYLKALKDFPKFIRYTYFGKSFLDYQELIKGVNQSYMSNGWSYIKKITQLAFLMITGLYLYFLFLVVSKYHIVHYSEINWENLKIPAMVLVGTSVYIFWIGRYLGRLPQIISCEGSIEYFCWTFFIYRVQFLNSLGLVPVYFSKSFLRYYKNKMILSKKETIYDDLIDNANCFLCTNRNADFAIGEEYKANGYKVCSNHLNSYFGKEFRFNKFTNDDYNVHQLVKSHCYYD